MEKAKKPLKRRTYGCRRLFLGACIALGLLCSLPLVLTSPTLQWHIDNSIRQSIFTREPGNKESNIIAFTCHPHPGTRDDAIYTIRPDGSHLRMIHTRPHEGYRWISWSPDGNWLAMVVRHDPVLYMWQSVNYEIYRVRFDGLSSRRLTYNRFKEIAPRWSDDGKSIWFQSDGTIHQISIDGHEISQSHNRYVPRSTWITRLVDWSSNEQTIIGFGGYGVLMVGTNPDGSDWRVLTKAGMTLRTVAWAPNDEQIMYFTFDLNYDLQKLVIFNMKEQVEDFSIEMDRVSYAQWSPDARWIAIEGQAPDEEMGTTLYLLDSDTGDMNSLSEWRSSSAGAVFGLSWSPDSEWIAFSIGRRLFQKDPPGSRIFKTRPDGTDLQHLIDMDCDVSELAWSPK